VDYFPRTRGISTLASPQVIVKMMRELGQLYGEVRWPKSPTNPVRLPPQVTAIPRRAKKASNG
jgi:hypothetical protein